MPCLSPPVARECSVPHEQVLNWRMAPAKREEERCHCRSVRWRLGAGEPSLHPHCRHRQHTAVFQIDRAGTKASVASVRSSSGRLEPELARF